MGESAGGASVGYHMISPLTRDLFQRAIIQSGSPLMPNSLVTLDQIYAIASEVTSSLGCNKTIMSPDADDVDDSVVECLKSKSVDQLLKVQSKIIRRKDDTTFCPSFYDDFLPENPIDAMRNPESYGSVPKQVLMGFNKDEGSVFMYFSNPEKYPAVIPNAFKPPSSNEKSADNKKNSGPKRSVPSRSARSSSSSPSSKQSLLPKSITNLTLSEVMSFAKRFMKSQNPSTTRNLLSTLYAGVNESVPGSVFNATRTNVGEFFVICPALFAATEFVNVNISVYFYYFVHRPRNTPWRNWVGAAHYEEVQFVFGLPLIQSNFYTKDEIKLSKKIMKSWTTFASTGVPSFSESIKWPQFKTATSISSTSHLTLGKNMSSHRNNNNDEEGNNDQNKDHDNEEEKYVEISSKNSWKIKSKLPQDKCNFWKLTYEVTHSQAEKPDSFSSSGPSSSSDNNPKENNSNNKNSKDTSNEGKDDEEGGDEDDEEDGDKISDEKSESDKKEIGNKEAEEKKQETKKKSDNDTNSRDRKESNAKKEEKKESKDLKKEEKKVEKEDDDEEGDEDGYEE